MFPVFLDLGFFTLKTYGLCMAIGLLVSITLAERLSGRKDISNLALALIIAGVLGSRIAYVIEHWSLEFAANPARIIRVDQGGLMFYGGLIAASLVFLLWCCFKKERPLVLGDLLVTVLPLGHAFGRLGCFAYGCCYGRLSNCACAVAFPRQSPAWCEQLANGLISSSDVTSLPVLPTQLFESVSLLILFAFMLYLRRRRLPVGFSTGAYLIGYALLRFPIEIMRGDPRTEFGYFSISQVISMILFLIGATVIGYALYRSRHVGEGE